MLHAGEEQGSKQRVQHAGGGVQAGRQAARQVPHTGAQMDLHSQAQVGTNFNVLKLMKEPIIAFSSSKRIQF